MSHLKNLKSWYDVRCNTSPGYCRVFETRVNMWGTATVSQVEKKRCDCRNRTLGFLKILFSNPFPWIMGRKVTLKKSYSFILSVLLFNMNSRMTGACVAIWRARWARTDDTRNDLSCTSECMGRKLCVSVRSRVFRGCPLYLYVLHFVICCVVLL